MSNPISKLFSSVVSSSMPKYYKNICCLSNEELVRLISFILYWEFHYKESSLQKAKVEIKKTDDDMIEFTYSSNHHTYKGTIKGNAKTDVHIFGTECETDYYEEYSWLINVGFSLRRVYKYLESIDFYKPLSKPPVPNENIKLAYPLVIFDKVTEPNQPFFHHIN